MFIDYSYAKLTNIFIIVIIILLEFQTVYCMECRITYPDLFSTSLERSCMSGYYKPNKADKLNKDPSLSLYSAHDPSLYGVYIMCVDSIPNINPAEYQPYRNGRSFLWPFSI